MELLVRYPYENAVLAVKTQHVFSHPKKGRMERSHVKSMLIFYFDIKGVVWSEFLPQGATVNSEYYEGVLTRLREAIRKKKT